MELILGTQALEAACFFFFLESIYNEATKAGEGHFGILPLASYL